jgi:hypothetical protein
MMIFYQESPCALFKSPAWLLECLINIYLFWMDIRFTLRAPEIDSAQIAFLPLKIIPPSAGPNLVRDDW